MQTRRYETRTATPSILSCKYNVEDQDSLAEDAEHVRKLLANTPADSSWRRRGYLALSRAQPDRLQLRNDTSELHIDMVPSNAKPRMAEMNTRTIGGSAGGTAVREKASDDWAEIMGWVLELAED